MGGTPKITWLSPFWDDWIARFGGKPASGVLSRTLKPLVDEHGTAAVRRAWRAWLVEQDPQYVSIPKFGQTYGTWAGQRRGKLTPTERSIGIATQWAKEEGE